VFITRFFNARSVLPKIRGTQPVLPKPQTFHEVREKMLSGTYDYTLPDHRIGIIQPVGSGEIIIGEGHHRIDTALDIYWKTGNGEPVQKLITHGFYSYPDAVPHNTQIFPAFTFWGKIRNWLVFR
jgi:hypothetical protein